MFSAAEQPKKHWREPIKPREKVPGDLEVQKELGSEFSTKVKEFVKKDWEATKSAWGFGEPKERKKGRMRRVGLATVTGFITLATLLSTNPGKKMAVGMWNGLKKWNPGNVMYRVPDALEYHRRGVAEAEPMGSSEVTAKINPRNLSPFTEFKMGDQTFYFYDSVLGLVDTAHKLRHEKGGAKIEVADPNIKKLLSFEYQDIKSPENQDKFRDLVLFYAKRTLQKEREGQHYAYLQKQVEEGVINHPLAQKALSEIQILEMRPDLKYSEMVLEVSNILHTLESELIREGVVVQYPERFLRYDQNPGPQNLEELIEIAQTILDDNLTYDPAVSSWFAPEGGYRAGEGNALLDMYSANGTPIDKLLLEKKSGVCRHYADAFAAVCRELQQAFPGRFENVYVTTSSNLFEAHKYNTISFVESPNSIHAITYEPQGGGVGEVHNTPAYELLELMYQRNYISKEDFYHTAGEYFSHLGIESRTDLLGFLERLKGDGTESAHKTGREVLDAIEKDFDERYKNTSEARNKASILYDKDRFLREAEEYRLAFGFK